VETKPAFRPNADSKVGKFPAFSKDAVSKPQRSFDNAPDFKDAGDPGVGAGSAVHHSDDPISNCDSIDTASPS
jgi:hypothetical protein